MLIDHLNGVITLAEYQTDIDRSDETNSADVLRVIDLLNGAGAFPEYLFATLPDTGGGNGNGNDNGGNENDNGGNGNDNGGNGNDNGGNENDNGGNGNDNGGNGNDNGGNENDNGGNGNDNGGNENDNGGNENDNGGNGNDNGGNGNDNGGNGNDNGGNGNDNGGGDCTCPDGDIRLWSDLSGSGSQGGGAEYRLDSGGRERFQVDVWNFGPGSYDVSVSGVVVGQISVGGSGMGSLDVDTNDGNFPPNFPSVCPGDTVDVGGQASGTFVFDCS